MYFLKYLGAVLLGIIMLVPPAVVLTASTADAVVCQRVLKQHVKARRNGKLFIRYACKKGEVEVDPFDIGMVGPAGPSGETGPMGPMGPMGPIGAAGLKGDGGVAGEMGPAGPQGEVGPTGPIGPTGPVGETGPAGPKGDIGPVGPAGDVGPAGPKGDTGATGAMGPIGLTGPMGPEGPMGPTGPAGSQGEPGAPGSSLAAHVTDLNPNGPIGEAVTVNPGSEGTVAVRASFPVGSGSVRGYRVTFSSPLCPDTGCDISNCVNIAVFQGLVAGSGNPHSSAAVLYAVPDPNDVASVDVYSTGANVTSFVFSLEALCVNALL